MKLAINKNLYYYLFPLLWFAVIVPKQIVMLFSVMLLPFMILKYRSTKKDKIFTLIFLIGVLQIIAIFMSFFYARYSFDRYIAALNIAVIWFFSAYLYLIFKNKGNQIPKLEIACYRNLIVLFLISIVGIIAARLKILSGLSLYVNDWNNGVKTTRLLCFMEYKNCVGIFTLVNLPLAIRYIEKIHKSDVAYYLRYAVIILGSMVAIVYSGSRICLIAYLLYVATIMVMIFKQKFGKRAVVVCILILMIAILFEFRDIFYELISLYNSRSASNSTRFRIYAQSISTVLNKNLLFGVGIKEYIGSYPLGSHSTYMGIFYKNGLVGLIVFIFLLINSMKVIFSKQISPIIRYSIIAFFIVFIFEDIDGTNWIAYCFFALLGLGSNENRKVTILG